MPTPVYVPERGRAYPAFDLHFRRYAPFSSFGALSCGQRAGSSWEVLGEHAITSKDYFRKYVTGPHSMNPTSGMPPHSIFDNTFNALEAYFKAINQERN
jgi:hypothetical protein